MKLFPSAQDIAAALSDKLKENLPQLEASLEKVLTDFAHHNEIHVDVSNDDAGVHAKISFTPKGNQ